MKKFITLNNPDKNKAIKRALEKCLSKVVYERRETYWQLSHIGTLHGTIYDATISFDDNDAKRGEALLKRLKALREIERAICQTQPALKELFNSDGLI